MVFRPQDSYRGALAFQLPCGRCIGCRIAKARDWSTRMKHEASLHSENSFLSLTYEDRQLPEDGSISKRAIQLFLKRLRKELSPVPLRYFACGEYGDRSWRPHYHAIIFGYAFLHDRRLWRTSPKGYPLYRSETLERVWPFGHCEIGDVTTQSAGYVARYTMKKISGERAASHYSRPHPTTGEFFDVAPEFALMSRRPGLGAGWLDKYSRDAFPSDFVVVDGAKRNVPAYYKKKLGDMELLRLKTLRMQKLRKDAPNRTPDRLATREELQTIRVNQLKRDEG